MSFCRTIIVALLLGLAAYAVMAVANLWPLDPVHQQCDWQVPKVLSCLLGVRENLAGGVIGAAGALMAAWLAWVAIQKQVAVQQQQIELQQQQIAVQQRANLIADLTFWQRKYDNATIAMQGLEEVNDITGRCFQFFETMEPLEALRNIHRVGLLAAQRLPVTGTNLIAFRMAQLIDRLRHQHDELGDRKTSPSTEQAVGQIESDMRDLAKRIPSAVDLTKKEMSESQRVLSELKQSSHYPKS